MRLLSKRDKMQGMEKKRNWFVGALGNKPLLALSICYVAFAFTSFLLHELAFGNAYNVVDFDLIGDFNGLFLTSILLGIMTLLIGMKYFKRKPNVLFLSLLGIVFIGNLVAMIHFPGVFTQGETYTYALVSQRRIEYIFAFLNTCLFLYATYVIAPYALRSPKSWRFGYYCVVVFALFTAIYSFFSDGDGYASLFNGASANPIQSFTGNKNVFGLIMLFAILAEIMLIAGDKKWRHGFVILFFFIEIIFAKARSTLLSALVIFFILFIYLLLDARKNNPKFTIAGFSIIGLLVIFGILVLTVPAFWKISLFGRIHQAVVNIFTGESSTLGTRVVIWQKLWALLSSDPAYLIFGLGNQNFNFAFFYAADNPVAKVWHTHNGYLAPFGEGGLIKGIISLFVLGYVIYALIDGYKKKKDKMSKIYGAFLAGFMVRSFFESEYLFSSEWTSLIWMMFIVLPILGIRVKEEIANGEALAASPFLKRHIIYFLSPVLLAIGAISQLPYVRFPLIALGIVLEAFALIKADSKSNRINELIFVLMVDSLVLADGFICSYTLGTGPTHYLFGAFFGLTLPTFFYYLFTEARFFPNRFFHLLNAETKYKAKI